MMFIFSWKKDFTRSLCSLVKYFLSTTRREREVGTGSNAHDFLDIFMMSSATWSCVKGLKLDSREDSQHRTCQPLQTPRDQEYQKFYRSSQSSAWRNCQIVCKLIRRQLVRQLLRITSLKQQQLDCAKQLPLIRAVLSDKICVVCATCTVDHVDGMVTWDFENT